jgi:6-phosphogluconolactonase
MRLVRSSFLGPWEGRLVRRPCPFVILLLGLACSSSGGGAPAAPDASDGEGGRGQGGGGGRGGGGGAATGGTGGATGSGGASAGSGGSATGGAGGNQDAGKDVAAADVAASAPDGAAPGPDAAADRPPVVASGNPFVYVGSNMLGEIRIFQLDMQTGALAPRGSAPSGPNPDYIAFHPSGKYLYAINEVPAGRVVAFSIDAATGALTRLNDAPSGGNGPAHLSVHKSGNWVLTANYASGHAAALPIMPDGRVGAPVEPRLAGANAHMIVDDGQSGNFVFVPSKGDDRVLQFKFDAATGRLEPNTPAFVAQVGAPRHMVFHRGGTAAYLLTEAGRTVVSYRYDGATGLLGGGMPQEAAPSGDGAHIVKHPSKEVLYASIRFFNAIAVFTLNAQGRAEAPRHFREQIARPWDFAIDPTGTFMLVANNDNATVKVLRLDDSGMPTAVVGNGASVGGQPRFVGILPPRPPG